jgi:3-hydroxyisobutyrate dehydrogenase-like beta-hydroxyacid dehydrogenase
MKIGVLGTGMVGDAIASKLVALGREVMMGSRTAGNSKAAEWATRVGARVEPESCSFAKGARATSWRARNSRPRRVTFSLSRRVRFIASRA